MTPLSALCAVCKAPANSPHLFGFRNGRPYLRACNDPTCIALLSKVYHMPKSELDAYETKALDEAADTAGSYLDQIKCWDIREISGPQYAQFCRVIWETMQSSLKRQLENNEAPF